MQISNAPLKWLIPWASQSTSVFELPATTSDVTRASQSLGFPPQTMLPPESGGVPPQGIDFNAGLYQVARITWWLMYGGPFVYDATFATNTTISGYAQGAEVSAADYLGRWRSTVDNNQVNPDTTGTGWVPIAAYGSTITALTNANVTLTPLQAMKPILVFAGTLTGNVVVTLPAWVYEWTVVNSTSGNFTLTLTTTGGSGAVVARGGASQIRGDGTNINADVLSQAPGRWLNTQTFSTVGSFTYTPTPGTNKIRVRQTGGGGGGGGTNATTSTTSAAGGGGGAGAYAEFLIVGSIAASYALVIGAAGTAAAGSAGGNGGTTTFGAIASTPGGIGGIASAALTPPYALTNTGSAVLPFVNAPGVTLVLLVTGQGDPSFSLTTAYNIGGRGGTNPLNTRNTLPGPGGGGQGGAQGSSGAATSGVAGGLGLIIIDEYS